MNIIVNGVILYNNCIIAYERYYSDMFVTLHILIVLWIRYTYLLSQILYPQVLWKEKAVYICLKTLIFFKLIFLLILWEFYLIHPYHINSRVLPCPLPCHCDPTQQNHFLFVLFIYSLEHVLPPNINWVPLHLHPYQKSLTVETYALPSL